MRLEQSNLLRLSKVVGDHLLAHVLYGDFRHPAKSLLCLAGITKQGLHFCRTEVARVNLQKDIADLQGGCCRASDALHDRTLIDAGAFESQLDTQLMR